MAAPVRYRQNLEIAGRKIDGQVVIFDTREGVMRQLNPVATLVWESIEEPRTLEEVTARVCARFAVAPEEAVTDVERFLVGCVERNLVEVDCAP